MAIKPKQIKSKITSVTISFKAVVPTKEFANIQPEMSLTANLADGESVAEVSSYLREICFKEGILPLLEKYRQETT